MNVGQFVSQGYEQLPYLEKAFSRAGQELKGKILAARAVQTPKFSGIFLDVKVGDRKYSKSLRFDPPIDISAVAKACKSDETDDWIGQKITFVAVKGSKGNQLFANIKRPTAKKGKK